MNHTKAYICFYMFLTAKVLSVGWKSRAQHSHNPQSLLQKIVTFKKKKEEEGFGSPSNRKSYTQRRKQLLQKVLYKGTG